MVKIFIDPGHGGTDSGATRNGLLEKNLTLQISRKIRDMLNGYEGVQVRLSRDGDQTLTLKQRTDMANAWRADYLISVHINAAGGTGFESFIYPGLGGITATNQNLIHTEIMRQLDVTDRGKKAADFHMLRESNMPAILTENLFIDHASDVAKLKQDSYLEKIARGHVNGLVRAYGLKKKSPAKPIPTLKPTPPKKEEPFMLEKAIVINGFADFPAAERLAVRLQAPIYLRSVVAGKRVAKELVVVGGNTDNMVADKVTLLSGADRFETANAVGQFIKGLD